VPQRNRQQVQGLHEPRADDDVVGRGADAPDPGEVLRERLPQAGQPSGVGIAQVMARCRDDGSARGGKPAAPGKAGQVRAAWCQVIGTPASYQRRAPCFGVPGGRHCPVGDAGARALPGGQPSLGDQLAVSVGHRVAGHAELGGKRARGWEQGASSQAAAADGFP
jgi:hypothetical protein